MTQAMSRAGKHAANPRMNTDAQTAALRLLFARRLCAFRWPHEHRESGLMGKKGRTRTSARYVAPRQMSVSAEVSYIKARAVQHDARVVSIGPLILFSTQTGDAWVLDPVDGLALRLAQNGDPLPARIIETPERYMIGWNMTFQIDGDAFICLDSAGREQTIVGYPTAEIHHAMGRGKAS